MVFSLIKEITPGQLSDSQQDQYVTGPLSDLDVSDSNFRYDIYSYPIVQNPDFPDKGHNIIFYINIPVNSYWSTKLNNSGDIDPVSNRNPLSDASKFGLRPDTPTPGAIVNAVDLNSLNRYVLTRHSKRTSTAISLYIPDTMLFAQEMQYESVSLTDSLGIAGQALTLADSAKYGNAAVAAGALSNMLPSLASRVNSGLGATLANVRKVGLSAIGIADNPQNFLLFKQIDFRRFQFEFILTPENAKEASIINQIIYLFRFHSSPEVALGSLGSFFVPPSDFDIDIVFNGKRNPKIPRISTCILNTLAVDYASAGQWSTTDDGMPLQIKLIMTFTETSIVTKDTVQAGF